LVSRCFKLILASPITTAKCILDYRWTPVRLSLTRFRLAGLFDKLSPTNSLIPLRLTSCLCGMRVVVSPNLVYPSPSLLSATAFILKRSGTWISRFSLRLAPFTGVMRRLLRGGSPLRCMVC
jgi:hypothetical protein